MSMAVPQIIKGTGPDLIEVLASATLAGGVGAHFNLVVDGQTVGSATVGTVLSSYGFRTTLAPGRAHDIQVVYDNDTVINGQDRNLKLQSIAVNGRVVGANSPYEQYRPVGQAMIAGSGDMVWSGTADFALPISYFPASPPPVFGSGPDTVMVTASATLAAGVGAHFNLVVDGKTVGNATAGTALQGYSFHTTLATGQAHDIRVVFDNDAVINGQDRNLSLQPINVDGRLVNATDTLETYTPAGQSAIAGSGNMLWSGTADFALPASYFPSAPAPVTPAPVTPAPVTPPPGFYVATSGSDGNDGSMAHPFATLGQAQSAMEHSSTWITYVKGGTYKVSQALTLTSADNGRSFIAAPGEAPVFDGGAQLPNLITLNGASGITLSGLSLINTAGGGAALDLEGASGNSIVGNHFANTAEAILLGAGSSKNTLSGNQIDNSATSAIEIKDASNANRIDSNLINGTGALNTTGGGVFLHGANANTITHNLVENTAGMGIGVSNWDDATINVGNVVQFNAVLNTNRISYDSGAIYMLGRSHVDTKAVIANNLVDGTGAADQHTIGIYLDDSTSGVDVSSNVVRNIGTHGAQIHGGDNNNIHNNIFDLGSATASAVLFQSAPADTGPTNTMLNNAVTRNIIYSSSLTPHLYDHIDGHSPVISNNLYYNTTGAAMQTGSPTLDSSPVFGNPNFVAPNQGNYAMAAGSAAASIGFQPIDQTLIGLHPATAHWYAAAP